MIRLTEHSEPVGDGISVTGPDGREVAHGPVIVGPSTLTRAIDARQQGSYVVEWLAVGSDSHPARGAFFFSVGEPTKAVLPGPAHAGRILEVLGRWLSLLGFALGFGVPFAALLSGGMTARLWRLVSAGVVLMIVAEPVALLGQTALLAPSRTFDGQLIEDVLLTSYGHLAALRLGAAIGLWALAGAVRGATPRAQWSIPALGAVVAIIEAGNAHRFDGLPAAVAVLLVAVHVAAFGAWIGCIVVALAESRARAVAHTASLAAFGLVVTGAGLALGHLESVSDLVETGYGADARRQDRSRRGCLCPRRRRLAARRAGCRSRRARRRLAARLARAAPVAGGSVAASGVHDLVARLPEEAPRICTGVERREMICHEIGRRVQADHDRASHPMFLRQRRNSTGSSARTASGSESSRTEVVLCCATPSP